MQIIIYGDFMSKIKALKICSIIVILIITLTGCSNNKDNTEKSKEKVIEEIKYLDTNIVNILNELNNISLENYTVSSKEITTNIESKQDTADNDEKEMSNQESSSSSGKSNNQKSETEKITVSEMKKNYVLIAEDEQIDWETIKSQIELINSSWAVIAVDLQSLNVEDNEINEFENLLNEAIIAIKNSNKEESLMAMSNLYDNLPKILTAISAENNKQNIYQTKAYVLKAYSMVEQEKWGEIKVEISNARTIFNNMISDNEYYENNKYKVDKEYGLLKDLENAINYEDKEVFYIKYKNTIQGLNTM